MSHKITHLEVTCPNCGQEIEVEAPDGVSINKYFTPSEIEANFYKLNNIRNTNKAIIEDLYSIFNQLKGWRNKKARGKVKDRIVALEEINMKGELEWYNLYNAINPPVGENSNS